MPDSDKTMPNDKITISDSAAKRIALLIAEEENKEVMLRVTVSGGGCSGFQYSFGLDDKVNGDDVVFKSGDVGVVVDETSLDLLQGSELDYVEDLIGSFFSMKNPNATSTCGCGSSFSV